MFNRRSRRPLAIAFAALAIAGIAPSATATHSWGGYHWARTTNPLVLDLGDNVTRAWESYLATAASDWSKSAVLDTQVRAGFANPKTCKGTIGRVEVCNSTYGNNGWLGVASISITGGTHITKGTVKLNDTYFNTAKYNTPAWRNLVVCQEVGHTFGLDHQDENFGNANLGTCMDYTNDPSSNQHPNAHDYEELGIIYAHLDSTNTATTSALVSAGVDVDHNDPKSWGKLVKQRHGGRMEIYELDLGGGAKTVTFVFWSEEHPRK